MYYNIHSLKVKSFLKKFLELKTMAIKTTKKQHFLSLYQYSDILICYLIIKSLFALCKKSKHPIDILSL